MASRDAGGVAQRSVGRSREPRGRRCDWPPTLPPPRHHDPRAPPTRLPRPGAGRQQPPRGRVRPRRVTRRQLGASSDSGPRTGPGRISERDPARGDRMGGRSRGAATEAHRPIRHRRDMETAELVGRHRCRSTSVAQLDEGGLRWHDLSHQVPGTGNLHLEHKVARLEGQLPDSPPAGSHARKKVVVDHRVVDERQPAHHRWSASRSSTRADEHVRRHWVLLEHQRVEPPEVASRAASAASGQSRWTAAPSMRDALAAAWSSVFTRLSLGCARNGATALRVERVKRGSPT